VERSLRLTCATAILAVFASLPAQAATFLIDLSLGGGGSSIVLHGGDPFSTLRVTGEIETSATGPVAASALERWQFSFFRDAETAPVASIRNTDTGANAGTGTFEVVGNDLFSSGFLLGVWSNLAGIQHDTSIRFNANKQLVIYAREDDLSNNEGSKSFETGFSLIQNTSCATLDLSQSGPLACAPDGRVRIGQLAARVAQPVPVPLPAAGFLLLAGLAGLGIAARRRATA
jgi:hypothetical protein